METGVSESANGDQADDKFYYWKLSLPDERLLFVDSTQTEEFSLFLTALEEAKIVAMDAEWKPVQRAGVSPRVSILQLSCRIGHSSQSWATMEKILLSRKIRADVEESLESIKSKQMEDIQKQKAEVQKQKDDLTRAREELQNEKKNLQLQKANLKSQREQLKEREQEEANLHMLNRKHSGGYRDGSKSQEQEQSSEHEENKSTLSKLKDGLKGVFLGRNAEVSEIWEPETSAAQDGKSSSLNSERGAVSPKGVDGQDSAHNVDNLCDVLAQAEAQMLKEKEGQSTGLTEENLEELSKEDSSEVGLNGVNMEERESSREENNKDLERELDKVNRNFEPEHRSNPESKSLQDENENEPNQEMDEATKTMPLGRGRNVEESCRYVEEGGDKGSQDPGFKSVEPHKDKHTDLSSNTANAGREVDDEEYESGHEVSDETALEADGDLDEDSDTQLDHVVESCRGADGERSLRRITEEESENTQWEEVIFVLDLLALTAADIATAMKKMLCSTKILKLGFAFKQDQRHLAASFPGQDAYGCFDKVEPYVDIAKLYKQLVHVTASNTKHQGKRFVAGGTYSLTGISKAVLGVPLCKIQKRLACSYLLTSCSWQDSQCSDWEQRPLSQEQIEYAAADTHCLLAIFDALLHDALNTIGPPPAPSSCSAGDKKCMTVEDRKSSLGERRGAGLAQLLSDKTGETNPIGNIFTHKMGTATVMVEAAIHVSTSLSPRDSTASEQQEQSSHRFEKFVKKYSDRLLVNATDERKSSSHARKPKGRRAREALKNKDAKEEDFNWVGPALWDVRIGGDGHPKFLCDVMVEGLARQLRCCGIDAASPPTKKSDPRQMVEQATGEGRILLTKDAKLLRRRLMPENLAYFVRTSGKWEQLEEVMKVFEISVTESDLLSRCVKCNGEFVPKPLTAKEASTAAPWAQAIPASALSSCDKFWQCSVCHHIFWQGFQFDRARQRLVVVCVKPHDDEVHEAIQPLDIASAFLEGNGAFRRASL